MAKRRLALWGQDRGTTSAPMDPGELWPAMERPSLPGPCLAIGAAGAAAGPHTLAFGRALGEALAHEGSQPAWTVVAADSGEETLLQSAFGERVPWDGPSGRARNVALLEQAWPRNGWVWIWGLGVLAVRRPSCSIVLHEGTQAAARYPLFRALREEVDLVLWRDGPSLRQELAARLAAAWRGAGCAGLEIS